MSHTSLRHLAALGLAALGGPALAGVVTFSGSLDDNTNTALVASDLGAAQFADGLATANNVALYALQTAVGGNVSIRSTGFDLGGIDPYVTLFRGTDPATATWLESNFLQAFSVGGDFTLAVVLAAGDYTLGIGVFANQSFAENGGGFLSDGFTGLGGPQYFGDGTYALSITLPDAGTVPEPGGAMLALTALLAAAGARRRRRTRAQTTNGGR